MRRPRLVVSCALALALSHFGAMPAEALGIDTRLWVTNGRVATLLRSGNTLYLGGSFSVVGPQTGSAVPIDATSGAVLAWNPNANGSVATLAWADGLVYAGGSFGTVGA